MKAKSKRAHAILSASSAKRWLNCPPSALLQEQFPRETSPYAEEGTAAHKLGEYKIRHDYLGEEMKKPLSEYYDDDNIIGYSKDAMDLATDVYADFVSSVVEDMKRNGAVPLVLIEERLDFSNFVPDGFGTGDAVVFGKTEDGRGLVHIIDYKHGAGVFVSAEHNPQMMLYALGALNSFDYIYDVDLVRMSIVQPRMENISTCECSREELLSWGNSIKPTARLAFEGEGVQRPGEWCRFCAAKALCKARADEALSLAREEFADLDGNEAPVFKSPGLVEFKTLEEILPTLSRIDAWIDAVFAYVSAEAINNGTPVKGYKVVRGRTNRVFTDTEAVIEAAQKAGYNDLYKSEMRSLTELEKLMGKKTFQEILGSFVTKRPGKLTLVPESDKRAAVKVNSALDEFETLN